LVNNRPGLDRSFDALSHPVRRAILERLARAPSPIGAATRDLGVTKPAVTKHVKVLEDAGFVRRRVVGRTHWLELQPAPLGDAARWLEAHRALWEAKFDAVESYLDETAEGGIA
jgi:DNA-binding transcriptional ArsR family regulator